VNTGANIAQGEPYCTRFGRHCPQADGSCKYPAKCLCLTYSEQTGKCPLNRNHRKVRRTKNGEMLCPDCFPERFK